MIFSLIVIPPFFSEGMPFDVTAVAKNNCGEEYIKHGVYFGHVYYLILSMLCCFFSFIIPIITKLSRKWVVTSYIVLAWHAMGLVVKLVNLWYPSEKFRTSDNPFFWITLLCVATLMIIGTFIKEAWADPEKQSN